MLLLLRIKITTANIITKSIISTISSIYLNLFDLVGSTYPSSSNTNIYVSETA